MNNLTDFIYYEYHPMVEIIEDCPCDVSDYRVLDSFEVLNGTEPEHWTVFGVTEDGEKAGLVDFETEEKAQDYCFTYNSRLGYKGGIVKFSHT